MDGDQEKNLKQSKLLTSKRVNLLIVLGLFMVVVWFGYFHFIAKPYPYCDPVLLNNTVVGENETLVVVTFTDSETHRPMEDLYVRLNNPKTGDSWEYYTNKDGEVWVKTVNTSTIHTYISKEGYHSELINFHIIDGERLNLKHQVKPFTETSFYINVKCGDDPIPDAVVEIKGIRNPVRTNEEGYVLLGITEIPKTLEFTVTPPEKYGEPYATSYTIEDYWLMDRIVIFFEKPNPDVS